MKKPGKTYRGVLKARISKLYGGDVTIAKAKKLKARKMPLLEISNWQTGLLTCIKNKDHAKSRRKKVCLH
jgi:hypothetical protein